MTSQPQDGLDPQIRLFVKRMGEAWRKHPPLSSVSLPEARLIADKVRGTFTPGGPQMARTSETAVRWEKGSVRIRVYDPHVGPPKPALLYLHGGGWTLFSIDTHDRIMREYAARANIIVIGN